MSERIGTFCEKCRQVVCICSKLPTTVRGWLETLPEPLRTKAIRGCIHLDDDCSSLHYAIGRTMGSFENGCPMARYWWGVKHFVENLSLSRTENDEHYKLGYNAAKAAYELAKRKETESTNGKEYGVSFVSVSAERLAELESKEKVFDDMVIALGKYYTRKEQGNG